MDVLQEFPGEPGLLLWKSLRGVMVWVQLSPAERTSAPFLPQAYETRLSHLNGAGLEPALAEPLRELAAVLRQPPPESAAIATACRRVAEWAAAQVGTGTALAFTQAAALAQPEDASLAYATGALARERAEHGRAESWFRQSIVLARRSLDWEYYSRAYSSLGRLEVARGSVPAARRAFIRAARSAGRHNLREYEGAALHDLARLAMRGGRGAEAARWIRRATAAYPPAHPALLALALDVARSWLERGSFAEALKVLAALRQRMTEPLDRLGASAALARAAGGAADRTTFAQAREETMRLAEEPSCSAGAPGAMLELAHGAAALGEWSLAEEAAGRALEAGTRRGAADDQATARALLDAARSRRVAGRKAKPQPREAHQVRTLADAIVASLEAAPRRSSRE